MNDLNLDIIALQETWISSNASPTIKADIAAPDCSCQHVRRETASRGGGLTLVYRQYLAVKPYLIDDIFKPSSFEVQLMKINTTVPPTTIVNIYRPPSSSRAVFLDYLAELIAVISADTNAGLLLCGDVNCAGTNADNIDDDLQSVFDSFGLTQHVNTSTRGDNLLDIIVTEDPLAVSGLSVDDAGLVRDHRLVIAKL